jgi:hypothetical protein
VRQRKEKKKNKGEEVRGEEQGKQCTVTRREEL